MKKTTGGSPYSTDGKLRHVEDEVAFLKSCSHNSGGLEPEPPRNSPPAWAVV